MLLTENLKIQDTPILIDTEKLFQILDKSIESDPSIVVRKIDTVEPEITDFVTANNIDNNSELTETNCLALTVKQDYNLSIFKNAFFKSIRMSFKVAISTLFLNIAKIFL